MKKILISIVRPIVKGIYHFVMATRRTWRKVTGRFSRNQKRGTLGANDIANTKAVVGSSPARGTRNGMRSKPDKVRSTPAKSPTKKVGGKVWWKDKYVIISAGALVVALVVILVLVLPSGGTDRQRDDSQVAMAADAEPSGEAQDIAVAPTPDSQPDAEAAVSTAQLPEPAPTPIATTEPDLPDMIPGCHDVRIIAIQERLMALGYMGNDEPSDYYGRGTEYALQLFQRKHSLQVDGILGEKTLIILFEDEAKPYTVKIGDEGSDVASLQERLKDLKYLGAKADGNFGEATETAVKSFQERNGLYADGNVGEQTREVLFSDSAKEARSSSGGGGGGGDSGGGSSGPVAVGDPDGASADALVEYALSLLGKKYVLGGKGPEVFDCSGFVYYCLNRVGYEIRYMTSSGWAGCNLPRVEKMSDMQRGDIICFRGHVGIYMGNDKMVDASSSNGCVVTRSNISKSSYWTRNFICARRVF